MTAQDDDELVLTSRRAWLHDEAGVRRCRLRLTDTRLELAPTAAEPAFLVVALEQVVAVRTVRPLRPLLEVETAEGALRFRCFAVPAVAGLIRHAVADSGPGSRPDERAR